jgi:cyclopropane-fatty-acyl-phospholipid synthase
MPTTLSPGETAIRTNDFRIVATSPARLTAFLEKDPYSAALDYLHGDIDIRGDVIAAIRFYALQRHSPMRLWATSLLAKAAHSRVGAWLTRLRNPARDIAFHYDLPTEFYALFLDPGLNYSCAYYRTASDSLADAQAAKLDHICRKLQLVPQDRFLDIGCGWGSLLIQAANGYGVSGEGFTLSRTQSEHANRRLREHNLHGRIRIEENDFALARGLYTKIASVGMFEHIGPARLPEYLRHIHTILADDGLFLNHGIARPDGGAVDGQTLFLDRFVFPGSGLVPLSMLVREANLAGFEVIDVENLRPHYALTCRAWVNHLQQAEEKATAIVGATAYRTWLLYLAASAINFEDAYTEVHQVLMAKRGHRGRQWLTRDFLYRWIGSERAWREV